MKLTFLDLTIENFKSFNGKHAIPLDRIGVHFLCGRNEDEPRLESNGAGKSTIFDALTWCLYGQTPSGLKNPDVKPWSGKKPTRVLLTFKSDKIKRSIERSLSPNKLLLDDKEVGQEAIFESIGLNYIVAVNTIILGQGQPLFLDLPPRDKMQLFSDTLQLERWDSRADIASDKVKGLQNDEATTTGAIQGLEIAILEIYKASVRTKQQAESWDKEWEAQLKEAQGDRKKIEGQYERAVLRLNDATLKYDGAETELIATNREIDKLAAEKLSVDSKYVRANIECESLLAEGNELKAQLDDLKVSKVCPTCGQQVKKADLVDHLEELKFKSRDLTVLLETQAKLFGELKGKVAGIDVKLKNQRRLKAEFQEKVDTAKASVERLQPEVAQFKAKLDSLKAGTKDKEAEQNPHRQQLRDLKKRKTKLEDDKKEMQDYIERIRVKLERNKFWIKGFKQIKLYLLDEILEELTLVTSGMLDDVGLSGWEVKYSVERETKSGNVQRGLNVEIKSLSSTGFVKWESWSGGESQRLRIIGSLALAEVLLNHAGVQSNLEILDEPTKFTSRKGVRDLCSFLGDRARMLNKSVFYVDHQAVQSSAFVDTITVVKDKRGSYIEDSDGV